MPDSPHQLMTKARRITREGELQWGGDADWSTEIAQQDGVTISNGGVVPSPIIGPTDGLLAYFPLDGERGSVTDVTGNGHDGTASGVTRGVSGVNQSAFEFHGDSGDEVVSDSLNPVNTVTASAWINWNGPYNVGDTQIVVNEENQYEMAIADGKEGFTDGTVTFAVKGDGTGWTWRDTGVTIDTTNWHHLVLVFTGTQSRMYVDGTRIHTADRDVTLATSSSLFRIGNRENSGKAFNGRIDEVSVYDIAFTDQAVTDLYTAMR